MTLKILKKRPKTEIIHQLEINEKMFLINQIETNKKDMKWIDWVFSDKIKTIRNEKKTSIFERNS